MYLEKFVNLALTLFHTHRSLAYALLAGLAVYALLRPKAAFKLLALIGFLLAALYLLSLLAETVSGGSSQKQRLIERSQATE